MANPIKRVRDFQRYRKPQQEVTYEQWEDVMAKYNSAVAFFKDSNMAKVVMEEDLKYAEDAILENRIREVREEHTITEMFKKTFITPKKVQDDELIGQIKFIRKYVATLQEWITIKEDFEQREANGQIVIQRNKDGRR
jgi:hypothetical protein